MKVDVSIVVTNYETAPSERGLIIGPDPEPVNTTTLVAGNGNAAPVVLTGAASGVSFGRL